MRLIDAEEFIESLKEHFDSCFKDDGTLLYSDHICTSDDVVDLIKIVDEQLTAYDIDKVVQELEDEAYTTTDTVCGGMFEAIRLSSAIEIVKHGCVGKDCNNCIHKADNYDAADDFCEWEKLNDCKEIYSTGCGNFCAYRPKSINCKYCGKKIRLVE